MNEKYASLLGQGNREIFIQFFTRIYREIPGVILAEFSKLKFLNSQHFINFRNFFYAKLESIFICPAYTFDNVKGQFPIGFMIWNTNKKEKFENATADIYDKYYNLIGTKKLYAYTNSQYINDWIKPFRASKDDNFIIGKFPFMGNDFQQQNIIQINTPEMIYNKAAGQFYINQNNLIIACIYFAVRKVIPATWLNDRDQFLYPNNGWENDIEFKNNCLVYTLFNNNISCKYGVNHWIPFAEKELEIKGEFKSRFMAQFLTAHCGKLSPEAGALLAAGRALFRYYHETTRNNRKAPLDASFYDIREFFQRRNERGTMNTKSSDDTYTALLAELRAAQKSLAQKIAPKIYEYGFLRG